MVDIKLKYVTRRRNKKSADRWYWQRSGFPLTRLPDDDYERWKMAMELNASADAAKNGPQTREGSMAWLVENYRESEVKIGKGKPYQDLAANTKQNYAHWLNDLETRFGHLLVRHFTRKVVVEYVQAVPKGTRGVAASVLKNLMGLAEYHGLISGNPAKDLGISKNPARKTLWLDDDLESFRKEAEKHTEGKTVITGLTLMLFTGQRPGDALRMSLHDLEDGYISVVQEKTGKRLDIPCHSNVKELFDRARGEHRLQIVVSSAGKPVHYKTFESWFREIREAAKLEHLQMRDLRRTAATKLKELGCTDEEVTAITGHSKASFQAAMADIYVVKTRKMARSAMDKWEQNE